MGKIKVKFKGKTYHRIGTRSTNFLFTTKELLDARNRNMAYQKTKMKTKTVKSGGPSKARFANWHRKYGDDFTYSHLHSKKAAEAKAESLRKKGKNARVVKGNYVIVTSKKRRQPRKKTGVARKEIRKRAQRLGLFPSWL